MTKLPLVACALVALVMASFPAFGESPESVLQEALAELQSGNVARARDLLETAVDRWPGYRQAHYHLGRLAFDRGDLEGASRLFQTAGEGTFPRAFSAWYYLGRTRILQRDFGGAIEALDGALERAPGFNLALVERGRARLFLGEVEAGLADLLGTLGTADPPGPAAVLGAQLLIGLGRADEARSVAEALRDRSQEGDRWYRRARWLLWVLDGGESSQAELIRAIDEDPDAGDLYWALGAVHLTTNATRSALLLRIALDHDSENPVSLLLLERLTDGSEEVILPVAMPNLRAALMRSRKLWEEDRYVEGARIARDLLERRPTLVSALLLVAREAERVGDLWQAAWIYERMMDWLGPVPNLGRNLAAVAHTMGAQDLAICGVEMALRGDPVDGSLYYLLGVIEAERGRAEAAVQAHERAFELGYVDVRTWLRLGELHFEQMDIAASISAYEKAMAMEPSAAEAVRAFALSSLTTEQYSALRDILEAHIVEHSEDINTLYSLGVMSLRDNDLDAAKEYFLRLAKVAPEHRQVHYNLGQIYLRQGETDAGQAEMERFRQIKAAEDEEWEHHNQAHFRRVEARKLAEAGESEEAITLYTQSVIEGTAELSDYLELAAANLAAGHLTAAMKGYEGVLSSYPYHREALAGLREAAAASGERPKQEEAASKLKILDWPCKMTSIDQGRDP